MPGFFWYTLTHLEVCMYTGIMTRPRLESGKRIPVSARVSEDLSARLDARAAELGMTRSELIASVLAQALAAVREQKPPPPVRIARARCPHPGLPRNAGGWCALCGVKLEPGGFLPA